MKNYNFYDTSSLLLRENDLFKTDEEVIISSITLNELENIKSAYNKDIDINKIDRTRRKSFRMIKYFYLENKFCCESIIKHI